MARLLGTLKQTRRGVSSDRCDRTTNEHEMTVYRGGRQKKERWERLMRADRKACRVAQKTRKRQKGSETWTGVCVTMVVVWGGADTIPLLSFQI
jgi:hypothetical protein